ncbi:3-isopropylmalate dehydratase large subunit [Desulfamplus magnetovallimortis]|uniref:3-isopropylmalate dehydratase large subunit n=1 Tax=Desulfamplus magnetovallimortis TaxID=1246637 RepID=A0A1W1HL42_9BACT|nr:3-isopropylmalate dehydratase large subunit [Desulfamplus magnetovallimortis]SLM33068.1 3-isopropylmalate dehydratase large subunit [Desulfamplus magnetovallimortis]
MGKTVAEKIFDAHHVDNPSGDIQVISLDAVFCHEITTPIAINDLVARGKDRVFDASKIKAVIDHVTPAKDSKTAMQGKILRDWAIRHGIIDFFDIGRNGVCHAIFPEKGFVRPGYTIIMGDSHTCTHGAFGAFAAGVGTTDLEVGILKGVCAFKKPESIKVEISGNLPGGVYAKDVILSLIGQIGVNGATNKVLEFCGTVVESMTMDQRMTLCNMAVEAGATSGICAPDIVTVDYLWPFIEDEFKTKDAAMEAYSKFTPDADAVYSNTIQMDVTNLQPMVTYGYKPDQVKPVAEMIETKVDQVYIGSCTNGRLEDLEIAASILRDKKIADSVRGIVSPATPQIYSKALDRGFIKIFMDSGFCVTNPTCGACLGMSNGVLADGEVCAATTNRNFNGRMGKGGMVHLMSPATAAATAITGKITNSRLFEG